MHIKAFNLICNLHLFCIVGYGLPPHLLHWSLRIYVIQILCSLNAVTIAIKVRWLYWICNCSGSHHSWWQKSSLKWIKVESNQLQAAIWKVNLFVDCHDEGQLLSLRPHLASFLVPHTTISHSIWEWIFLHSLVMSMCTYKTDATIPLLEIPDLQSRKKPNHRMRCQFPLPGCMLQKTASTYKLNTWKESHLELTNR